MSPPAKTSSADVTQLRNGDIKKTLTIYSREEVAKHKTWDDIWIIIDNKVYDVTSWMGKHPGGSRILEVQGGCDVTETYLINHDDKARLRKNVFLIGYIRDDQQKHLSPLAEDIFSFKDRLMKAGKYTSETLFYVKLVGIYVFWFSLGWYFMLCRSGSWLDIFLSGSCMSMFLQQMALLGHDLGHNSVSMNRELDHFVASVLSVFVGISVSWWKINHHTHHAVTNSIEHDPDIQHLPFLSITKEQLEKAYFSKYYKKWFVFDAATKFLISRQHWLMPIVLCFSRINLVVHSIGAILTEKLPLRCRIAEIIGLGVYFYWIWFWSTFAGTTGKQVFAIFVLNAVAGNILSIQIGISHWISPVVHFHPGDTEPDWFQHQLTTTIDVDCYPINDWFHGGLQFQTIHHLMPRLPRCRLREAREELRAILKKHNIEYPEMSFYNMLITMWLNFRNVALEAAGMPTVEIPKPKTN